MAISRRDFILGGIMTGVTLAANSSAVASATEEPLFPPHPPLGKGKGIYPGRVIWVHDPETVKWDGVDYWWRPENYNGSLILKMIGTGIMKLTGQPDAGQAWKALFAWRNAQNGSQGGYKPGEKIAIKVNMNGAGEYNDDPHGNVASAYGNAVLLKSLLVSMVEDGKIRPEDVLVYDTCRIFPDYMQKMCTEGELRGVGFRYRDPSGTLDAGADLSSPIHWVGPVQGEPTYFPECLTRAKYLINLANLKGHSWGLTLGAKNHFGSFVNRERRLTPQAAGLHDNIINAEMGDYSVLIDLVSRSQINSKTILYILDALITAPSETGNITPGKTRWQMAPFNGSYPCSLFFSQDPIALDSVGADFLTHEPTMREYNSGLGHKKAMENYLHEGAEAANPPSGTRYTDGMGNTPESLGVHEHWNNPSEKLYSRNRGMDEGIELLKY